jgi:hypothetical protein
MSDLGKTFPSKGVNPLGGEMHVVPDNQPLPGRGAAS